MRDLRRLCLVAEEPVELPASTLHRLHQGRGIVIVSVIGLSSVKPMSGPSRGYTR